MSYSDDPRYVRQYARPAERGEFSFDPRDRLQVNRISRDSPEHLYQLLTWKDRGPALRKDGKHRVHQPPKHRDPKPEFYHAQCLLYGLKPFKSRDAAKKELLRAFGSGRQLPVPQHLLTLEDELDKEYAVANEAAKAEHEKDKRARAERERAQQLKRKKQEDEILEEIGGRQSKQAKMTSPLDLNKIAARYAVVCPYLRENYDQSGEHDEYQLTLAPEASGKRLYGCFDLGSFEGCCSSTSINIASRTIKLHWTGRESGEGESTFGDNNVITITFIDDQTFEGQAEGDMFERCQIIGRRDVGGSRNRVFHKLVSSWKEEYEGLDMENHEREAVARWH